MQCSSYVGNYCTVFKCWNGVSNLSSTTVCPLLLVSSTKIISVSGNSTWGPDSFLDPVWKMRGGASVRLANGWLGRTVMDSHTDYYWVFWCWRWKEDHSFKVIGLWRWWWGHARTLLLQAGNIVDTKYERANTWMSTPAQKSTQLPLEGTL